MKKTKKEILMQATYGLALQVLVFPTIMRTLTILKRLFGCQPIRQFKQLNFGASNTMLDLI